MTRLDPFTDEFQQCPYPTLAALRRTSPVQALVEPGWYVVTTMDLVREVLTDPGRFSNQVSRRTPPPPEVAEAVAEIRAHGFPYVPTLLLNDPPRHTQYRRLVQRAFTPRALAWMEPLVADVAEELAARLPDGGPMDLIEVFTRPLPVWAISRVLGLPDDRRDDVRRWTDAATATIGAQLAADRWPQVEQDLLDFQRTVAAELERRRDHPSADLLGTLVQATAAELGPDEEAIGVGELVSLTRELMVAGNESSLRLLADIVWQLDARPEEWERVRADPQRADRIVERRCVSLAPQRPCSAASCTTPRSVGIRSGPERRWSSRCFLPTGTRRCFLTPTASIPIAQPPNGMSPSGKVFTPASAMSLRAWKPATPCRPSLGT
jgi:cytochrome P450